MTLIYPTGGLKLKGKTLLVPIVSTANVAQLAVDLLIASLGFYRVAIIDPSYFIPIAGGRDDGPGITTPSELYGKEGSELIIMQQRSPILKFQKQEFIDAFFSYFQSVDLAAILFLSGMDLSNRTDVQMLSSTYQIVPPSHAASIDASSLQNLHTLPIPAYTSPVNQYPQGNDQEPDVPFIPGGGLTRRFLSSLPTNWSVPTAALLQFVSEGDNRDDAYLFARVIAKVVNAECPQWSEPKSWKTGLFGSRHDGSLYG